MLVSVLIPTYNRAQILERVLSSLCRQTFPITDFEIIVIDDGSSDDTKGVCLRQKNTQSNLLYVKMDKNAGQCAAYNAGLAKATGKYILCTDDDCIPEPDWIAGMVSSLQHHPVVAGCILTPDTNLTVIAENISQFHPFWDGMHARKVDYIAGANMGYQREVLDRVGHFKEGFPIPDMELILRVRKAGIPVWFHPAAKIVHSPRKGNFGNLLRQTARYSSNTILLRDLYADILTTPFFLRNSLILMVVTPIIAFGKTAQIYITNTKLWRYFYAIPAVFVLKLAWCWGAFKGLRSIHR